MTVNRRLNRRIPARPSIGTLFKQTFYIRFNIDFLINHTKYNKNVANQQLIKKAILLMENKVPDIKK